MKFERMIAIVMLLLQRKKVTGKELADMFEVSLRTIYRDIESINAAGIPIVTTTGVGGGIGIMEQYKIEKGIFTIEDISTLLIGLGIVKEALSTKETSSTYVKLRSFISEEMIDSIAKKTDHWFFDLSSWMGSQDSNETINTIKAAVEQRHLLAFYYFGQKGNEHLKGIEPHRLVFKNSQWYLQGYAPTKQDFRLYKLRRMQKVQTESVTFKPRLLPHPFGIFTDRMHKKTIKIKVLVDATASDRILDYCKVDDLEPLETGQFSVSLDFIDDDYGYGILMSFGNQLICMSPDHVRDELHKRLKNTIELYK